MTVEDSVPSAPAAERRAPARPSCADHHHGDARSDPVPRRRPLPGADRAHPFRRARHQRSSSVLADRGRVARGAAGGRFAIESGRETAVWRRRSTATARCFRGRIYAVTQLPLHHAWCVSSSCACAGACRLPGCRPTSRPDSPRARSTPPSARGIALVVARREALCARSLAIAAGYHVACWAVSGRTIGGAS